MYNYSFASCLVSDEVIPDHFAFPVFCEKAVARILEISRGQQVFPQFSVAGTFF